MSQFRVCIFFFGSTKNLGICEAAKDCSGASSKKREKKEHLEEPSDWTAFAQCCDVTGLQMLL